LGKTWIFIFILGWFLVITGALFLVNPQRARNKLLNHGFGILKFYIKLLAIYLAIMLVSVALKAQNPIFIIASVAGVVAIIAGFLFLKKKVYNKLAGQFQKIPLPALKIFAWIQISVGALMLILQRRIW
jgi:hypothetical protein